MFNESLWATTAHGNSDDSTPMTDHRRPSLAESRDINSGVSLFSKSVRLLTLSSYTVQRKSLVYTSNIAVIFKQ